MSTRKGKAKFIRVATLACEPLEPRQLLSGDALSMYIYGGDSNQSGFVDIDDYGHIDFNASTGGVLTGWYNGDFNYNGVQDIGDYGIIDFVLNDPGLHGTAGDDVITITRSDALAVVVTINGIGTQVSSPGEIRIDARRGDDLIDLTGLNDFEGFTIVLSGGAGDDTITGSGAAERIFAGDGNDVVSGNDGRDTIYGEAGDDSIRGGGSSDLLDGGDGADTLRGSSGNDNLAGGANSDRIRGGDGNDRLDGGGGRDLLAGESGDDFLIGGAGDDLVNGGRGLDIFQAGSGNDTIDDDPDQQSASTASFESTGLTKTGAANLDLSDYKIVISQPAGSHNAADYTGATGLIGSGQNFGFWTGSGITTSLVDATPTTGYTMIGIATATETPGVGATDTWAGRTITGSDTTVMYTYGGDYNYDGVVDIDDFTIMDFANPSRWPT